MTRPAPRVFLQVARASAREHATSNRDRGERISRAKRWGIGLDDSFGRLVRLVRSLEERVIYTLSVEREAVIVLMDGRAGHS